MSTEIEVAFVGRDVREFLPRGPSSFDRPFFDDDESTKAWDDRPRVTLSVEDDETLVSIFDRAIEAAGVFEADWTRWDGKVDYGTYRYIALRDDDSPISVVDRLSDLLTLADDDGRARWGQGLYGDITYAQLRAAAAAGAVPGNPAQIYLNVRLSPAGGAFYVEWELVIQVWEVAYRVAEALAAAGGVYYLYEKVKDRLAGYRVVEAKSQEWLRRNGYADLLQFMLRGEPWSPRDLAGLLGCTAEEAERILALYGYERESPARWVYVGGDEMLGLPSEDLSARVVKAYATEARHKYASAVRAPPEELEALFKKILEQAIDTGEVTGLESDEYLRRFRAPG